MTNKQKSILWFLLAITVSLWLALYISVKLHVENPDIINYQPIDFKKLDKELKK